MKSLLEARNQLGSAWWISPDGTIYKVTEEHATAAKSIPGLEGVNLDPDSEDISGAIRKGWIRARAFRGSLEASIPTKDAAVRLDKLLDATGIVPDRFSIEVGLPPNPEYVWFDRNEIRHSVGDVVSRQLRNDQAMMREDQIFDLVEFRLERLSERLGR